MVLAGTKIHSLAVAKLVARAATRVLSIATAILLGVVDGRVGKLCCTNNHTDILSAADPTAVRRMSVRQQAGGAHPPAGAHPQRQRQRQSEAAAAAAAEAAAAATAAAAAAGCSNESHSHEWEALFKCAQSSY